MPLIYGHQHELPINASSDIDQYTKWFELMNMDFELVHIGHSWMCNAWSREKNSVLVSGSGTKKTVSEALHACYSDIRSLAR
jgi:hypothetical protein